jgi:hypothetical protein
MANVSKINGFKPVKHLNGSPYNGQFNIYEIPAGDGTATMIGDLVKGDGTANTQSAYPTCIRGGASGEVTSGELLGVIVGIVQSPVGSGTASTAGSQPDLNSPLYRAASTKKLVMVADAPDLIFEVQDGGTVPCTWTLIGMNTGFLATAGSTVTGASGMTTGTTAPTTAATLPLRIMGIVQSPDNESATVSGQAYQKLLVMINTHRYGSVGTTGV